MTPTPWFVTNWADAPSGVMAAAAADPMLGLVLAAAAIVFVAFSVSRRGRKAVRK